MDISEVGRAFGMHGRVEKIVQGFGGRPEGKRPLGRRRCKWEDGIRMDLKETGLGMWIGFNWLRIGTGEGCCECSDEPLGPCVMELV
jgi:hypothetical protein